MDNWSGSKKNIYYLYSRFLLIGFIASMCFGCATRHTLEDVAGERAEYKFRVLDSDMPHLMIHWVEKPKHIETRKSGFMSTVTQIHQYNSLRSRPGLTHWICYPEMKKWNLG